MLTLTHIHLRMQDPEEAAQWYVDLLEARIIERYQTSAGGPSVAIDIGGARINIMGNPPGQQLPAANPEPHMGLEHFGLRTDDLEGLVSRLQAHDVEVLEPIRQGRNGTICYVKAPGNVRIELQQYAREPRIPVEF